MPKKSAFDPMIQRMNSARYRFVVALRERMGWNYEDASAVADLYARNKLVKYGANDGQFHVKHGVYLETDVLERALDLAKASN